MAISAPGTDEVIAPPGRPNRATIRVLSVITVLGVLVGVAGLLLPYALADSGAGPDADRKAAITTTTDFAVAYNTYDVANLADYQKRMKGLLSKSYATEFVKVTDSVFNLLKDKKQVSDHARVLGVALDSIDKDSAVTLVAVDASLSNTDSKAAVARHLRWRVSLVKHNGAWAVDKFESIATAQASAGQPSATPTEGSSGK